MSIGFLRELRTSACEEETGRSASASVRPRKVYSVMVRLPLKGATSKTLASGEFTITNWRPFERNTLKAFLTVTPPSGLVLNGCTLHEKGSRWVGMPAEKFVKADGTTSWKPIVEFASKGARDRFQAEAVRAVEQFLANGGGATR
jgi:hypothetical protein